MRLLPLTREQAREAITAPVARLGVSYEPALVEHLLDDLAGGGEMGVMPPQLQLVCSALYDGLEPDERRITLAPYKELGGARGVLQRYLDDELARLGRDEGALARAALEELVTSQGTKGVKTGQELAQALAVERSELAPVLEKLVRARLLRVLDREEGGTAYELAHEYLICQISLGAEAQTRKQAEELIRQEFENWQRLGTLLAADKLALVGEVREELRLGSDSQLFLLRSALQAGYEVGYWLNRVTDPAHRLAVLNEAARSPRSSVRQQAAAALGTQAGAQTVDLLLVLAVCDEDPAVRATAQDSLIGLHERDPQVVAAIRRDLAKVDRTTRRDVYQILSRLPLRSSPPHLRPRLIATRLRPYAPWFWGWVLGNVLLWFFGMMASFWVIDFLLRVDLSDLTETSYLGLNVLFLGIFGFMLGAIQWSVGRQKVPQVTRWLVAGATAGILGVPIGAQILNMLVLTRGEVLSAVASGAAIGAVVGGLQWLVVVRRYLRWSGLWVLGCFGGAALVSGVGGLSEVLNIWLVSGLVIGLLTVIPLLWLSRRFKLNPARSAPVLLALVLGAFLWGTTAYIGLSKDPVYEGIYPPDGVPVEIRNLPEDIVLQQEPDIRVEVTIRARYSMQGLLGKDGISAWVDLDGVRPGVYVVPVQVTSDLPIIILDYHPQQLIVSLDRLEE